jgi:4-methyl-5(b-hydroxyethyl)-thiazole monophosphate biosynthesis
MATVLTVLAEGFEELEAIAPIDLLRRANISVTVAALNESPCVIGRTGIALQPETTLAAALQHNYDLIVLPGGPGVCHLRADPRIRELVLRQQARGGLLAAICAAPTILHDAGLLAGRRYTAHPSVAHELPAIIATEKVVRDGPIITSRGAGTAIDFGLALVAALTNETKAEEIARSIAL